MPSDILRRPFCHLLALVLLAGTASRARAAEEDAPTGLVFSVATSRLSGEADRLKLALTKPLRRFEAARGLNPARKEVFTLALDFNPNNQPSASTEYEDCLKFANLIRKYENERGVRTVAWVHGPVLRHSVLPVLACQEIVMSDATATRLGEVVTGAPLRKGQVEEYDRFATNRLTPAFVLQKMYDPALLVVKVNAGGLPFEKQYREKRDQRALAPLASDEVYEDDPPLRAGAIALFTFDQAKKFNLCEARAVNSVPELCDRYHLPKPAEVPDTPTVCRVLLNGTVSGGLKELLQRRLDRARELDADVVILQLECGDGDAFRAAEMAQTILNVGRPGVGRPIKTIAYVAPQARNTATFLALACDRIVMHPDARLGDFERFLDGRDPAYVDEVREKLAEVAVRQGVPPALARGLVTKNAQLHWVHSVKGESDRTFLDHDTFVADQNKQWRSLDEVQPARGASYLALTAKDAERFGLIDDITDDWRGAAALSGVPADDVRYIRADVLDQVAEFLRHPVTSGFLILFAVLGLMLELKMPGSAFPGIVAAVCFILYFWSQSQFNDETTVLAVLLFVLGLILIGLEIFIIPGFGIPGMSGILLVIGSLSLVAYGHWPRSSNDWGHLGGTVGPIGLFLLGGVVLAFVGARYLPNLPGAKRLFLRPPDEAEDGTTLEPETPALAALLGVVGVAASPLRPAGKMRLGEEFVDVVAEGGYIEAGTTVQVIEIEGNRVVVKSV